MGATALTLAIAPIEGETADPKGLYDALFDALEANVRRFAKGKPYQQVLAYYLHACKSEGDASDRGLSFVFGDSAGLCSMSAVATQHWFEVLLGAFGDRLDALARAHGLAIREKRSSLEEALAACDEPLVVLRNRLFAVRTSGEQVDLISDDLGDATLDYALLKPAEKKKIDGIAASKTCACKVCEALRAEKDVQVVVARAAQRTPPAAVPASSHLHLYPDHALGDEELSRLALTSLAITGHAIRTWEPIYALTTLRKLWLSSAPELAASLDVTRLPRLEELEVLHCGLPAAPNGLRALTSLRVLDLYGSALTTLPALPDVRVLGLAHNRFTGIPPVVTSLTALEELRLTGNPIVTIADDALPRTLRQLELDETKELTALPESIGELTALEHLAVTESKLTRLPDSMRNLKKLTYLALAGSTLPELPSWLGELEHLRTLYIHESAFTRLPESMRALHALKALSVIGTNVFPLPDWIAELRSLERLLTSKAHLPRGELQRLRRLLPNTKITAE